MEGFRFTVPYVVRIADINYGGHASNAAVLYWFQDARVTYLENLGLSELDIGGCGLILPEARVRYLAEMFRGDELRIGVKVGDLRRSGFAMEYRVERGGKATAEGSTALVAYDYGARKPVRLPEAFRQAVSAFENLPG